MRKVADEMANMAQKAEVKLVFTIIPTKELVYAPLLKQANIPLSASYSRLIEVEHNIILALNEHLKNIKHIHLIELVEHLQDAAMKDHELYPLTENGHPQTLGYTLIAQAIAKHQPDIEFNHYQGPIGVALASNQFQLYYAKDHKLWQISSVEIAQHHHISLDQVTLIYPRYLAHYTQR